MARPWRLRPHCHPTSQVTAVFVVLVTVSVNVTVPPGRTVCVAVGKIVMATGSVEAAAAAFLHATIPMEITSVAKSARYFIVRRCPLIANKN